MSLVRDVFQLRNEMNLRNQQINMGLATYFQNGGLIPVDGDKERERLRKLAELQLELKRGKLATAADFGIDETIPDDTLHKNDRKPRQRSADKIAKSKN